MLVVIKQDESEHTSGMPQSFISCNIGTTEKDARAIYPCFASLSPYPSTLDISLDTSLDIHLDIFFDNSFNISFDTSYPSLFPSLFPYPSTLKISLHICLDIFSDSSYEYSSDSALDFSSILSPLTPSLVSPMPKPAVPQ